MVHSLLALHVSSGFRWIPAFAGMTLSVLIAKIVISASAEMNHASQTALIHTFQGKEKRNYDIPA